MSSATRTAPLDIVVALRLTDEAGTLADLAGELGVVPSQVHAALRRLQLTGLLRPGLRAANARALADFLIHGVRYAFPVAKGPLTAGIPTAYSAPPLAAEIDALDVVVWPAPNHPGAVQGFSIAPLYRAAPVLKERAPRTYQLVAVTDALRLGDPRTRLSARAAMEQLLGVRA